MGWALLLTGASDCRRRVFLPVVCLFIFEVLILNGGARAPLALTVLVLGLILLVVVARLLAPSLRYWREFAMVEFLFWAVIVGLLTAYPWLSSGEVSRVVESLSGTLGSPRGLGRNLGSTAASKGSIGLPNF